MTSRSLTDADIRRAASTLGCDQAAIRAVLKVESSGKGFDPATGKPIILFEPHWFSRLTSRRYDATHPHLSYRKWGARPYPAGQAARWEQLGEAAALDRDAALQSASWGLFQVMGFNFESCGFTNVERFVEAMSESEGCQLDAFVAFVSAKGLDIPLRAGDWATFAKGYNGPAYAEHHYDKRLAKAFDQARAL